MLNFLHKHEHVMYTRLRQIAKGHLSYSHDPKKGDTEQCTDTIY